MRWESCRARWRGWAIATTGTGTVLTSRIVYRMASRRVLPSALGSASLRFRTPVIASILVAALTTVTVWVPATGLTSVLAKVVEVAGLLAAMFCVLTAAAMMACYRQRLFASPWDFVMAGVLPLGAIVFPGWVICRSLQLTAAAEQLTVTAIIVSGLAAMACARLGLRSAFFQIRREHDTTVRPAPGRP